MDETLISYMRQSPREEGVDIVTALARLRIIREYEALAETAGLRSRRGFEFFAGGYHAAGRSPANFAGAGFGEFADHCDCARGRACGYRCTELPAQGDDLTPQMLLEEIYPVAAFYQDTWHEGIQAVRVAGLGARLPEFVGPLENEFKCEVRSLLQTAMSEGRVPKDAAQAMADYENEGLVGWMLHRN